MTLLNISLTSTQWSIISFCLLQLIALGKAFIHAYSKISLLEERLETNATDDASVKDQIKEVKGSIKEVKESLAQRLKDKEDAREKFRSLIFKELKRIEDKGDGNDKSIHKRTDEVAQAVVRIETTNEIILKHLDKIL